MHSSDRKMIGMDMTDGKIMPTLVRFAIPLLLANLIQQLYSSVDMMIVGKVIGSTGTVGVSIGGALPSLLTGIGMSLGNAAQICSAQMCGAGERKQAGDLGCTVLWAMLLLAAGAAVCSIAVCRPFLGLLNCPGAALDQASGYMRVASLGLPFVFGYNALCGVMRGMGESKKPLLFITVSAVSNVAMDLLLVVAIPLEAVGSAIATVIAQAMAFLACLVYISLTDMRQVFNLRAHGLRIKGRYLIPVARLGIPLCLQYGCIQFSQLICTSWVNGFGILASATTSIGNKVAQLIHVMTASIDGSAGSVVAQNLGAHQYGRVRQTVYAALGLCLMICAAEFAVAILAPTQLFALFTDDPETIAFGKTYMHVTLITFFLNALQGPYTAVITGSGNTTLSFAYGILDGIVLRLGIAYVLAYGCHMGVTGYWYGNALAHLGPVIIGIVYFYRGTWASRRLASEEITEREYG